MLKYVIAFSLILGCLSATPAITYDFSGGRFGDNVLTYLHAKWLSHQYRIPLLYKPFTYSSELIMHDAEIHFQKTYKNYNKQITLSAKNPEPCEGNDIFICPYFPEIEWELKREPFFTCPINWKNEEFRSEAKKMIASRKQLALTWPPSDQLSIALHMREGGGYDDDGLKLKHPLKVPPVTFYIDSLNKVLGLFKKKQIFCYVFTDALNPQEWIDKIVYGLPSNAPISFHYRVTENRPDLNVLEDFYSLFNFDILIRGESNYSIVPSLIHDYAVVCSPKTFSVKNKIATIDEIRMEVHPELYKKCTVKYPSIGR